MKIRKLGLLLIAVLVVSTATMAQRGNSMTAGQRMNPEKREMMMKHRLQQNGERQNFLTEEQKGAMKNLRLETAKKVKPLKNKLREMMAHQKSLTTADNVDMKAINKNIDKIAELRAEMAKIMAAQQQQVRKLLTDEQRLRFDSMNGNYGKSKHTDFKKNRMRNNSKSRLGERS